MHILTEISVKYSCSFAGSTDRFLYLLKGLQVVVGAGCQVPIKAALSLVLLNWTGEGRK